MSNVESIVLPIIFQIFCIHIQMKFDQYANYIVSCKALSFLLEIKYYFTSGYFESYTETSSGITVCRWNDNGPVTVASNFQGIYPLDTAQRWDGANKKHISVSRPDMVKQYNKSMGGTDAMDGQFAPYHPMVRNRKWYWPFFIFFLKTCIYNSWHLHRQLGVLDPLLGHIRAITRALLHQFTKNKKVDSNGGNIYDNSKCQPGVKQQCVTMAKTIS